MDRELKALSEQIADLNRQVSALTVVIGGAKSGLTVLAVALAQQHPHSVESIAALLEAAATLPVPMPDDPVERERYGALDEQYRTQFLLHLAQLVRALAEKLFEDTQ